MERPLFSVGQLFEHIPPPDHLQPNVSVETHADETEERATVSAKSGAVVNGASLVITVSSITISQIGDLTVFAG